MLTHIYLNEVPSGQIKREVQEINDRYNDGIHRIAHKMATATGKTPVMAMLILYHTANYRNAAPDDHQFTRHFLVITPGLTVRERLQDSLDPGHEDSDWKAFNLVPPGDQWEQALASASVNVINYHQMQPKDMEPTSTRQQQLIDGGSDPTTPEELETRKETPRDVVDRIADGKSQQGPILVINDEGHHCHRGDPDKRNALPQNTQWFEGIQQIRETTRSSTSGAPCNCSPAPSVPAMPGCTSKSWNTPTARLQIRYQDEIIPCRQAPPRPGVLRASHGAMAPTPELNRIVKRLGNHRPSQHQLRQLANLEPALVDDDDPVQSAGSSPETALPPHRELTPQQLALWKAVQHAPVQGLALREIARQFGVSRNTLRKYARALTQPTNRPQNHGPRPLSQLITKRSD